MLNQLVMKNLFIKFCYLLVAGAWLSSCNEKPQVKIIENPNILFITCDQRMFQSIQAKGFHQPAIDRLAERGVSFINPHDIFFADVNPPGEQVQKSLPGMTAPIPTDAQTSKNWNFSLWSTLDEPLRAPGRPEAHWEFYKATIDVVGEIPIERRDMWYTYENFYLNLLRENDRCIEQVLDALDDLNLRENTVVVFTSDHGELGGAHGGLRNKGPVAYEQNVHVPMIVIHPNVKGGQTTQALTSHIDVLPTLVGLTGAPKEVADEITKDLPGRDFSTILADPSSAPLNAVRPKDSVLCEGAPNKSLR